MVDQKRYILFVAVLMLVGAGVYAKRDRSRRSKCATEQSCLENKQCQCYCSGIADFRDKVKEDRPVYIENDPNGVHCYCKPWDLEKYPGPAERD